MHWDMVSALYLALGIMHYAFIMSVSGGTVDD